MINNKYTFLFVAAVLFFNLQNDFAVCKPNKLKSPLPVFPVEEYSQFVDGSIPVGLFVGEKAKGVKFVIINSEGKKVKKEFSYFQNGKNKKAPFFRLKKIPNVSGRKYKILKVNLVPKKVGEYTLRANVDRKKLAAVKIVVNEKGTRPSGDLLENELIGCDGILYENIKDVPKEDVCGVCDGDGTTCLGCDGFPNSGAHLDACGVCNGFSDCLDPCGIPFGDSFVDECGVCLGDGSSCADVDLEQEEVPPEGF